MVFIISYVNLTKKYIPTNIRDNIKVSSKTLPQDNSDHAEIFGIAGNQENQHG
jgi:hypothetical protein